MAAVVWNKVSVPKFSWLHYSLLIMSIGLFDFTACTAIPVNMGGSMTHSWSNLRVVYSRSGRVAVHCNWRSLLNFLAKGKIVPCKKNKLLFGIHQHFFVVLKSMGCNAKLTFFHVLQSRFLYGSFQKHWFCNSSRL